MVDRLDPSYKYSRNLKPQKVNTQLNGVCTFMYIGIVNSSPDEKILKELFWEDNS